MSPKILVIMGSARGDGHTRLMVDSFRGFVEADFIDLNEFGIGYFDYSHSNQGDDFLKIAGKMVHYEALVFASPVYWYSMSAVMKTFFDRFSDLLKIRKDLGRQLRGKKMAVVASSSDSEVFNCFFEPFRLSADYLGMEWKGCVHGWIEEKNKVPAKVLQDIRNLVEEILMPSGD